VAQAWSILAAIQTIRGDFAEADRLLGEALAILDERFGSAHPSLAGVLADKGSCLSQRARETGDEADFDRADALLQQAHAITVRTLGPHHRNAAHALNGRAVNARYRGDDRLAAECYEGAIEVLEGAHPDGHPIIVLVLNNLGGLHEIMGEKKSALDVFGRSHAMAMACGLAAGHVDAVGALRGLARAEFASGAHERSAELHRRLVDHEQTWGLVAEDVAFDKARLGMCLRSLDDDPGGLALLREAFPLMLRARPDHRLTLEVADVLAAARADGE
jgi:tetratricopeptide (TPR) repeat protein